MERSSRPRGVWHVTAALAGLWLACACTAAQQASRQSGAPSQQGPVNATPQPDELDQVLAPGPDAKHAESAATAHGPKGSGERVIHPSQGAEDCLEMYGSCTPPPDQLCTSNAFVLGCGETGQLPSNGELLKCVCP